MARGCTFIDEIETQPITGANMRFNARTGDDVQVFSMERATAIKVAHEILREAAAADIREQSVVVPFERAG